MQGTSYLQVPEPETTLWIVSQVAQVSHDSASQEGFLAVIIFQ
jgi:hypothetical protein